MAAVVALKPPFLKGVFTFVLVLGVTFYLAWGLAFNALFDLANYTASAIMIFTGLFGMLLYRELEKEETAAASAR